MTLMAEVVYVGRHDGVFIPLEHGGEIEVLKHAKVKVPDSMLEGLLAQPENWELYEKDDKAAAKTKDKSAKDAEGDN